jgi:protease II
MINGFAVCAEKELLVYATRDKFFKTKTFIKEGLEREAQAFNNAVLPADFSNDCNTLLYTSSDKKSYLYAYDMQSKTSKLLLKKPVVSVHWSADNRSILLWVLSGRNWAGDLYQLSYPSLNLKQLTNTPNVEEINPSFLDENIIIFGTSSHGKGEWRLATYDLNSGKTNHIGTQEKIEGKEAIASSNKESIIYVNHEAIHRLNTQTGEDKIIAHGKMPQLFKVNKPSTESSSSNKEDCNAANLLFDKATVQIEAGNYKKALELYRQGYALCPMKDVEEMMVWLMGEVVDK